MYSLQSVPKGKLKKTSIDYNVIHLHYQRWFKFYNVLHAVLCSIFNVADVDTICLNIELFTIVSSLY